MLLDEFLTQLRALDEDARVFGSAADPIRALNPKFLRMLLDEEWGNIPAWLKSAIDDAKGSRAGLDDRAHGLIVFLRQRGHDVGGVPTDARPFGRVADAIETEAKKVAARTDDTPDLVPARWFSKNTLISADDLRKSKETIGWKKVEGGQNLYSKSGAKSRWPQNWMKPTPAKVKIKDGKA